MSIADDLLDLYTRLEEFRRRVDKSDIWKAICNVIVDQGEDNPILDFPWFGKLYVRGGSNGISLRKVSPYAKVVLSKHPATIGHHTEFRADIALNFIDKDDGDQEYPREHEKEYEIGIPYSLLEEFTEAGFNSWLEVRRNRNRTEQFDRLKGDLLKTIRRYPELTTRFRAVLEG